MKELSKYTKKERHEIYIKAKKKYIEFYKTFVSNVGMCDAIYHVMNDDENNSLPLNYLLEIGDELPEMRAIKPSKKHGIYWWAEDNCELRLNMFDIIIKMTKS